MHKAKDQQRCTIPLPAHVYDWLSEIAAQHCINATDYIRRLVVEHYLNSSVDQPVVVYFVQSSRTEKIKLGATSNFPQKFTALCTVSPVPLHVLGTIQCSSKDAAFLLESALKHRFLRAKGPGDWFIATPELLKYINENAQEVALSGEDVEGSLKAIPQVAPQLPLLRVVEETTKSGFKGVYSYGKRWAAVIRIDNKQQRIGVYNSPAEAAQAYDTAMVANMCGDPNAAVNFPGKNAAADPTLEQMYAEWATHLLPPKHTTPAIRKLVKESQVDHSPLVDPDSPALVLRYQGETPEDTKRRLGYDLPEHHFELVPFDPIEAEPIPPDLDE
jgi:hypothetical protein